MEAVCLCETSMKYRTIRRHKIVLFIVTGARTDLYCDCDGCVVCMAAESCWPARGEAPQLLQRLGENRPICEYMKSCNVCVGSSNVPGSGAAVEFQQAMRWSLNFLVKHGPDRNI
jgi:hypothetical protein